MQPVWMSYIATSLACRAPDIGRPYRYGELGCGAGINLLVAAASNPLGEFVGVDFNAGHIALARQAAQSIGLTNVEFIEASFGDFAKQDQQPFDFIACHGTWSWLPPQAQASILKALHRYLKPGGLFYLAWQYAVMEGDQTADSQALGIDDVQIVPTLAGRSLLTVR